MAVKTDTPTAPLPHFPPYLSVNAASTRVRKSPGTVRRWLRNGRLRGRKVERGGPGGTWEVEGKSCEQLAAQLSAEVNAGVAVATTPVDSLTLKAIEELTQAVQALTIELRQERLLPAPKRPWWRLWQRGGS